MSTDGNARTAEELYAAVERAKVADRVARQAWRIAEATADLLLLAAQETEGFRMENKEWAAHGGIGGFGRRLATESGATLARLKVEAETAEYDQEPVSKESTKAIAEPKFSIGQFVKAEHQNKEYGKVVDRGGMNEKGEKLYGVRFANGSYMVASESKLEPA